MSGWIKLHRSLKNWEWYNDPNTLRMLIHLLVSVNYEKKKWKGIVIKEGELITSYENLGKELGLSRQQVRTSLGKLETSREITRKRTRHCLHLSLEKWDKLQSETERKQPDDNPTTTRQQPDNNLTITPTKEYKEIKEEKEVYGISDFLKDWNEIRSEVTGNPSFVNRLQPMEKDQFNEISKVYTREQFRNAIKGLFKQDKFPKGVTAMNSSPKHFLNYFELYLTAYGDKNKNVWGNED